MKTLCSLTLLAAAVTFTASLSGAAAAQRPFALEDLHRLDQLPRLKRSIQVGMFSSYDRTGGNDDGFSGNHSFIRKEGNALVIAEMEGPGVITRIWTPTPTDDPVEFYFDGETTPRLRVTFRQLFDGTQPPFIAPLSGFGAGGFYTYVPIPYARSCKVVYRGPKLQFYQLNWAKFPAGHPIESYSTADKIANSEDAAKARDVFSSAGTDITRFTAGTDNTTYYHVTKPLAPGKAVTLYEKKGGGRIVGLRLAPASAFAGKERDILLRITWDNARRPAVLAPVGDFFGYSWGDPATRSVFIGTQGDTNYCYLPMPFVDGAKVELVSERAGGSPVEVRAEIVTTNRKRDPGEGAFYANWRRENPTTKGKPFTFVETQGRGHVVGVALQAQGPESGQTLFFEGDEQVTIDGALVAHGTGSEDFFNGGWYDVPGRWDHRMSLPLSGALDYKKALGRTGAYRFFINDAYAFRKSINLTIEHAPTGNEMITDYAGVTYLYLEDPPKEEWSVPPVAERRVKDLTRLVYVPGWNVPIHAFSFQNATLQKKEERIGEGSVRYLQMAATGGDVFGPHLIAFTCEVPAAGRYRVLLEALEGPGQAIVQLFQDERALGNRVDLYAAKRGRRAPAALATLDLKEGDNPIFIKLLEKNAASTGLGLEVVNIILERVD
jgi:hypothetical protein